MPVTAFSSPIGTAAAAADSLHVNSRCIHVNHAAVSVYRTSLCRNEKCVDFFFLSTKHTVKDTHDLKKSCRKNIMDFAAERGKINSLSLVTRKFYSETID